MGGVLGLGNIGDTLGSRLGLGSERGKSAYEGEGKAWKKQAKKWSDAWGGVTQFDNPETGERTETGKRFDELSGLYGAEVDRGAARAGQQTAAAYSRRGMSDSGYATGAQSDAMLKAAQARAQAREAARSAAVGERMNVVGNQAQISLSPYSSIFGAAAQRYMQGQAQEKQFQTQQALAQEEWFQDWGKFAMGGGMGGG